MSRLTLTALSLTILFLLWPSTAGAQTVAVAGVSGTVTDPSGSAIPGATVSMTETDKQMVRTVHTDATGHYALLELPVGPYRLEVQVSGFKDYVESGLELQVNNNIQINVSMQVGSVSERVEVQANASLVETRENSVSAMVDQQRINDLPLNGRQATQLILTLGAASYGDSGDTGSKTFWSATRISVAGGQGNGTAYLLDGGDNTDAMSNVNMPFPFPDALEEFSVETSAVSSRFGTHPGATVNVVTKSGSNQFHGDAFEYIRNGDMDARNFFAPEHDTLKRNQFGGTAGGKIITDKLFFFGGYQGTRNRSNPPQSTPTFPRRPASTGDFSTLAVAACQSSGKALTLKDPSTADALSRQPDSAVAHQSGGGNHGVEVSAGKLGHVVRQGHLRHSGDRRRRSGHRPRRLGAEREAHVIWKIFFDDYSNPPAFNGTNLLTTTSPGNFELAQSATIGDTYTFGPATLNSFHFSFNRVRDNRGPTEIPINWTMLGSNMYSAVPNFLLLTISSAFTTFCGTCAPGHFNVNSYQVADDVDLVRGRHQIGLRVQPHPHPEQHHIRLRREWAPHLQRLVHRQPAGGFHDRKYERLPADQPHSRRPAAMGHELLCAGQLSGSLRASR